MVDGKVPTRKVTVGAAVNAALAFVAWAANTYYLQPKGMPQIPAEQALALSTALTFFVQYLVPDA